MLMTGQDPAWQWMNAFSLQANVGAASGLLLLAPIKVATEVRQQVRLTVSVQEDGGDYVYVKVQTAAMNILSGKPSQIRILSVPERSVGYERVRGSVAVKVLDQYNNDFSCPISVQALLMDGNGNQFAAGEYIVGSAFDNWVSVRPDLADYDHDSKNKDV